MAMTVDQLVAVPSLGTRVLAGENGTHRMIIWAHVCELPEPWEWMGEGELLMTTGLGVPAGPSQQVAYVENMAAIGAAGIAIGEAMHAPPLTAEMLAAADACELPLMYTATEVPFMALSRAVVGANAAQVQARLASTERIYEQMRAHSRGDDLSGLLAVLSKELRHHLLVLVGGRVIDAAGSRGLAEDLMAAGLAQTVRAQEGPRRALSRLTDPPGTFAVALPAPSTATLVAIPDPGARTDISLIQHAAAVVAAQRALVIAARERSRRLGASLFARLLDDTIDPTVASDELADLGFGGRLVMLAATAVDTEAWAELHDELDPAGVPALLLVRDSTAVALLTHDQRHIRAVAAALEGHHLGISDPFDKTTETRRAMLQAQWTLKQPQAQTARITYYSEAQEQLGWLPRTQDDQERVARRVRGRLIDYDADRQGQLLESLFVFLQENRSWQRAAPRLHVHKQTLVYRMGRVEQLTERRLDSTADIAELWLGLQTGVACGLITPPPPA